MIVAAAAMSVAAACGLFLLLAVMLVAVVLLCSDPWADGWIGRVPRAPAATRSPHAGLVRPTAPPIPGAGDNLVAEVIPFRRRHAAALWGLAWTTGTGILVVLAAVPSSLTLLTFFLWLAASLAALLFAVAAPARACRSRTQTALLPPPLPLPPAPLAPLPLPLPPAPPPPPALTFDDLLARIDDAERLLARTGGGVSAPIVVPISPAEMRDLRRIKDATGRYILAYPVTSDWCPRCLPSVFGYPLRRTADGWEIVVACPLVPRP